MKKYKLGDICIFNAKTISRTENILIDYLETSNLIKGQITNVQSVCLLDAPSRAQRQVRHHTILYSLVRPNQKHYGILSFPQENLVVSTGFVTIDVKPEYHCTIDPLYLYAMLTQDDMTEHLQTIAEGAVSSYPALLPSDIANLEFDFPTFEIQRATSFFIDNLNRKIELNRAINHNLEAMIAGIMDYRFLSNINTLPKRLVGDIALIRAGGDCPQVWSKHKTNDCQVPIYSNGTDYEGLYGYTKEPTILKRGITVAARGTIGYCVMREAGYVPIIRLLAVTPNDIGGDVYLHQIFNRLKFKKDGSIQQQLTVPSIASMEIPYPNASALKSFADQTYPIIKQMSKNKTQIEQLTKLRDELLPLLMNGQVSVNCD
ncbi:restriction endonuclease subunit S [Porphyromonas miyakawae]